MAKKKKADEHHGGAWKVAYADFVTAMMALFMVLWISAQDQEILIATSQYFQSPFNSPLDNTSGVLPFESNASPRGDGGSSGSGKPDSAVEMAALKELSKQFLKMLNVTEGDPNSSVAVELTSDGLRVTLFDGSKQPLFEKDKPEFTEWGSLVMQNLAWLIDRQRLRVVVEGHARHGLTGAREGYNEWDLSTDQANAARRALTYYAVEPSRFERVSGFGDSQPLKDLAPTAEKNQRIVLSLSLLDRQRKKNDSAPKLEPRDTKARGAGTPSPTAPAHPPAPGGGGDH